MDETAYRLVWANAYLKAAGFVLLGVFHMDHAGRWVIYLAGD